MKIYKDAKGNYWIDNQTVPAGAYRLYVEDANTKITITPYDSDYTDRLKSIYDVQVSSLQKEDGTLYSDYDEFYFAMSGLFKNVFDSSSTGELAFPMSLVDQGNRTGTNTVFGDTITGIRKPSLAFQFQYGISTDSFTSNVNNGGSIEVVESVPTVSTGGNAAGSASINSISNLRYIPGQESYCFFTASFTQGMANSYQRAGLFDDNDGFFIGYEGEVFSFTRRRAGINYTQAIDIEAFNKKVNNIILGYSFDSTKGNIYKISYGYLGFATISLEILLPNGRLIKMDSIPYPNTSIETHITQTFLPVRGEVANTGNTTDLILRSGSITAGIVDGSGEDVSGRVFTWATVTPKVITGNSTIVTFRNKPTFNGIVNKINARLLLVSGAVDANKIVRWRLYKNPVITNIGTATWTDVNTSNSTLEYSTDAVVNYASSPTLYLAWNSGKLADFFYDLINFVADLPPNGIASFAVLTEATTAEVDLSIRWRELF